eukprot:Hpha_TRINITY_DN15149_c3_g1::TRINITY_DN15149_c3_g1_i1::g.129953::m.129953
MQKREPMTTPKDEVSQPMGLETPQENGIANNGGSSGMGDACDHPPWGNPLDDRRGRPSSKVGSLRSNNTMLSGSNRSGAEEEQLVLSIRHGTSIVEKWNQSVLCKGIAEQDMTGIVDVSVFHSLAYLPVLLRGMFNHSGGEKVDPMMKMIKTEAKRTVGETFENAFFFDMLRDKMRCRVAGQLFLDKWYAIQEKLDNPINEETGEENVVTKEDWVQLCTACDQGVQLVYNSEFTPGFSSCVLAFFKPTTISGYATEAHYRAMLMIISICSAATNLLLAPVAAGTTDSVTGPAFSGLFLLINIALTFAIRNHTRFGTAEALGVATGLSWHPILIKGEPGFSSIFQALWVATYILIPHRPKRLAVLAVRLVGLGILAVLGNLVEDTTVKAPLLIQIAGSTIFVGVAAEVTYNMSASLLSIVSKGLQVEAHVRHAARCAAITPSLHSSGLFALLSDATEELQVVVQTMRASTNMHGTGSNVFKNSQGSHNSNETGGSGANTDPTFRRIRELQRRLLRATQRANLPVVTSPAIPSGMDAVGFNNPLVPNMRKSSRSVPQLPQGFKVNSNFKVGFEHPNRRKRRLIADRLLMLENGLLVLPSRNIQLGAQATFVDTFMPVFAVGEDGNIAHWNTKIARVTGLAAMDVLGRPFLNVILAADRDKVMGVVEAAKTVARSATIVIRFAGGGKTGNTSILMIIQPAYSVSDNASSNAVGVVAAGHYLGTEQRAMDHVRWMYSNLEAPVKLMKKAMDELLKTMPNSELLVDAAQSGAHALLVTEQFQRLLNMNVSPACEWKSNDLTDIVQQVISAVRNKGKQLGVKIEFTIAEGAPEKFTVDRKEFTTGLEKVLMSAITSSKSDEFVSLEVSATSGAPYSVMSSITFMVGTESVWVTKDQLEGMSEIYKLSSQAHVAATSKNQDGGTDFPPPPASGAHRTPKREIPSYGSQQLASNTTGASQMTSPSTPAQLMLSGIAANSGGNTTTPDLVLVEGISRLALLGATTSWQLMHSGTSVKIVMPLFTGEEEPRQEWLSALVMETSEGDRQEIESTLRKRGHKATTVSAGEIATASLLEIQMVICEADTPAGKQLLDMVRRHEHPIFIIAIVNNTSNDLEGRYGAERLQRVMRPVQADTFAAALESIEGPAQLLLSERDQLDEVRRTFGASGGCPWKRGPMIGRGAFSEVFRATNLVTMGTMAVKVMQLAGRREDQMEDMLKEIALMFTLRHENVILYFYCERSESELLIFMEYAGGGSLAWQIRQQGKLDRNTWAACLSDILQGLIFLHNNNVVHRDMKSANVLLTNAGRCKLSDLGCATVLEKQLLTSFKGTPSYMAPEVVNSEPYDWRADIWATGIMCFEMSTGTLPWAGVGSSWMVITNHIGGLERDVPVPLPEHPAINERTLKFFYTMLQVAPEARLRPAQILSSEFMMASDPLRARFVFPEEGSNSGSQTDSNRQVSGHTVVASSAKDNRPAPPQKANSTDPVQRDRGVSVSKGSPGQDVGSLGEWTIGSDAPPAGSGHSANKDAGGKPEGARDVTDLEDWTL